MQKLESKNKSINTRVRQTRLDVFEDDQSLVDAKRKTKRKLKIMKRQKSNLDQLFPGNSARERGLLTVNSCIIVRL
jgi:hypothetical protein